MIEINLIPDVKRELLRAQIIRSRVITGSTLIGSISVAIVISLALYVFAGQTVRDTLANNDIKTNSESLLNVPDLAKTLTIQNQLTKISALNGDKKIDSRIFDILAAIIPPAPNDIQVSSLIIDAASTGITIEGQALNSYAAVEIFKKTIEGAKVNYVDADGAAQELVLASSISTSNTSYGESTTGDKVLRFTMAFTYAPEVFSPASKSVAISIATQGNRTDSFIGIPNSIFVDRAKDLTEAK